MHRREHARLLSRQSLEQAAHAAGLSVDAVSERILDVIKKERYRETVEDPQADRSFAERLLRCEDLWSSLALSESEIQPILARDIVQMVKDFNPHLDHDYLGELVKRLGGDPSEFNGPATRIPFIVDTAPVAWVFDNVNFAVMQPFDEVDGLPLIRYDHHADSMLSAAVRFVLGKSLAFDGTRADLRDIDDVKSVSSTAEACEDVRSILALGRGESFEARIRATELSRSPKGRRVIRMVDSMLKAFLLHHEYAHLLLPHVRIGPCHRAEYEADLFASAVMSIDRYKNLYQETWMGIAMLFLTIDMLTRGEETKTHPTAFSRFRELAARTGHGQAFLGVYATMAASLNPSLASLLGYEIRVDLD